MKKANNAAKPRLKVAGATAGAVAKKKKPLTTEVVGPKGPEKVKRHAKPVSDAVAGKVRMPRAPKVNAGGPVRIAISATVFATVSEIDWGFAYFEGEWNLVGKEAKCRKHRLGRYVADRMGLSKDLEVAYRDGNPLNCTRENVFVTTYVWVEGKVNRCMKGEDGKGNELTEWKEEPGYLYGNVGICRYNGNLWSCVHLKTGLYIGASWSTLKKAKHGVEAIHAERDLAGLDHYDKFKPAEAAKWRATVQKYREHV